MLVPTGLLVFSSFPVPAYLPVKIHADLEIDKEKFGTGDCGLEFEPIDNLYGPYRKQFEGEKWCIIMTVTMTKVSRVPRSGWHDPLNPDRLPECGKVREEDDDFSESDSMPEEERDDYMSVTSVTQCGEVGEENKGISDSERSSMHGEEGNDFLGRNGISNLECGEVSAESGNISKNEDIPENEEIQHGHQEKRLRHHYVQHPDKEIYLERINLRRLPRHRFLCLVELFSISVCPYFKSIDKLDYPLHLYGTVASEDIMDCYVLFDRGEKDFVRARPHDTIPLEDTHRCCLGPDFSLTLDLKDSKGRQISRGCLPWNLYTVESCFNKRICSVVPGHDGFAAIHYIIFVDAVQAKVKVSYMSKDRRVCQVRGKIWANYQYQGCSTLYEKKYYQSMLFKKGKTKSVELSDGDDVPLLKSVVAVPFDDVLVVEFDLCIVVAGKEEFLNMKAFFNPKESKVPKLHSGQTICGTSCALEVSLEWG